MEFNFDIVNILILVVMFLNLSLGLLVFLTRTGDRVNQYFFIFLISATGWCASMFLFRGLSGSEWGALLARILYLSAALIPLTLIYFIEVFPKVEHNLPKYLNALLLLPLITIITMTLYPGLLINAVNEVTGQEPVIFFNLAYHTVYALYIMMYFSICYVLLFVKYLRFKGVEKNQILYVLLGTLVATVIGVVTNLIMPYFGDFRLNWLGQIGIIMMIGSISYSIAKHRLFNLKIVATQFIVFLLCTSLFVRCLLSSNRHDLIINMIFLTVTIVVGIFLIRSVIQEVRAREEIEKLADDLKTSNEQQSNLLHFISHQVKGFLTKSRNIFSLFLDGDYGELPDYLRPIVEEGLKSDTKGVNTVLEILNATNFKKGTIQYKKDKFDLLKLLREIIEDQKKIALAKGLEFKVELPETTEIEITGDDGQMRHALRNLVDNAVKYTITGSVDVTLTQTDEKITISIKDTGVGIDPEDRAGLFIEGVRGKNSLKVNVDSTGYGLFIVKKIVEAHGGKIWVESEGPGHGSVFYVELPKQQ